MSCSSARPGSLRVPNAKRHHKDRTVQVGAACLHEGMEADGYPLQHMCPTAALICTAPPVARWQRKPANGPVQSYSVADAVVPCRAGAPAAKERNGSGPENTPRPGGRRTNQKNLEWSSPLSSLSPRLTKLGENLELTVGCDDGRPEVWADGKMESSCSAPECHR